MIAMSEEATPLDAYARETLHLLPLACDLVTIRAPWGTVRTQTQILKAFHTTRGRTLWQILYRRHP